MYESKSPHISWNRGTALKALTLAVALLGFGTALADTNWVILPHCTEPHRMLLHGLRDNSKPVSTDVWLDKKGKFQSLRIGNSNPKGYFVIAGTNTSGVTVVASYADRTSDKAPKANKRNYNLTNSVNLILRNSKSAESGVNQIRDGFKKGLVSTSMTLLIADAKRAFTVECSSKHFAVCELTSGFCVYAACWKLPNMTTASLRSPRSRTWAFQREWTVGEMLRRARQTGGTVSVAESLAASRVGAAEINTKMFEKAREKMAVNNVPAIKTSADGFLFEIDPEFPAVLSCAYVAFGPQRYTVYLPIPIGAAEKLPAEVTPNPWKTAALARAKAAQPKAPFDQNILTFENRMLAEFNKKREEARELLREKKTAEARKLLTENLQRQAAETDKFLKTLK